MHERQECESRDAAAVDAMDDRIGPKAANLLWEFYKSGASRGQPNSNNFDALIDS